MLALKDPFDADIDPQVVAGARAALETAGEQWTPLRAAVFDAMVAAGRPVAAYDLLDAVSQSLGRRITPTSLYRILDLFRSSNIVSRVESKNAFVVNAHPLGRHDCIFLVCDGCGVTTHLDDDRAVDHLRQVVGATGFRIDRPVIELRGRCAACAAS